MYCTGDWVSDTGWAVRNEEILTKAIEKASSNGFEALELDADIWGEISTPEHQQILLFETPHSAYAIIYDHDFAKALWGTQNHVYSIGAIRKGTIKQDWKHHLQMMVVADDPITYLGEHL